MLFASNNIYAQTTVKKSMGVFVTFMKAYETAERKVVVPVRAQR